MSSEGYVMVAYAIGLGLMWGYVLALAVRRRRVRRKAHAVRAEGDGQN